MSTRRSSLAWLALFTALGMAALISLGLWQLRRLDWKERLIAEVATRADAPPVEAPPPADWAKLKPADYEYRHVRVAGVYDFGHQARVFGALESPRGAFGGPGYFIMTPLRLADGADIIVNRGFVPQDQQARFAALPNAPDGPVIVTGLMRASQPRNWFTPADDPAKGEWFTRDPAAIAAALHLPRAAPFTIDADASQNRGDLPQGGETILAFPNNHLDYAFTWFGMAAALAGVAGAYALTRLRK
jgi:surfeit locus 1 family protein